MTDSLHIVPVNDLVEHELNDDCVCGPTHRLINGHWCVTHHSLDGRETREDGSRQLFDGLWAGPDR